MLLLFCINSVFDCVWALIHDIWKWFIIYFSSQIKKISNYLYFHEFVQHSICIHNVDCPGTAFEEFSDESRHEWIVGFPQTFDVSSWQDMDFTQLRSAVSAASMTDQGWRWRACCSDLETLSDGLTQIQLRHLLPRCSQQNVSATSAWNRYFHVWRELISNVWIEEVIGSKWTQETAQCFAEVITYMINPVVLNSECIFRMSWWMKAQIQYKINLI